MDKYEMHNQKQMAKYARDDWSPMPMIITPATFDVYEKSDPKLLNVCLVSMPLPASVQLEKTLML